LLIILSLAFLCVLDPISSGINIDIDVLVGTDDHSVSSPPRISHDNPYASEVDSVGTDDTPSDSKLDGKIFVIDYHNGTTITLTQLCAPPDTPYLSNCFNTTRPGEFGHGSNTDSTSGQWSPATKCPSCPGLGLSLRPLTNYEMGSYETIFTDRKNRVLTACKKIGMSVPHQKVVLAVGMQETKFRPGDIDKSKKGPSENFSVFNFNADMLGFIGVPCKHCMDSDSDAAFKAAVNVFAKGFKMWGVPRFLNFLRGGRDAFNGGVHTSIYGANDYRAAIAQSVAEMDANPTLMTSDERPDISVGYV